MPGKISQEIAKIQESVVGMYSDHPWPLTRNTDEEMGWRLKCLGITPGDYRGKRVLDMGCGTGEYALWYAMNGAKEVIGIDLSDGSLAVANERKREGNYENVQFHKMNLLTCDFPDKSFDYSFSVGVLHHTGDPYRGFKELIRVTKPGGIILLSLYNKYSRRVLRVKQNICKWLGGEDIEKRVAWGEKLFAGSLRKLDKRYHGLNTKQIAYDIFGFPHETLHSASEVLTWFSKNGIKYKGAFAPLRMQDYFYAFSQPEYEAFRSTFSGFPVMRRVADIMVHISKAIYGSPITTTNFPKPSLSSCVISQMIWIPFGLRFNCFTISGTRQN